MTKNEALLAWKEEICDRATQVDMTNELDWESLFIGFMIGKGIPIHEATDPLFYEEGFKYE